MTQEMIDSQVGEARAALEAEQARKNDLYQQLQSSILAESVLAQNLTLLLQQVPDETPPPPPTVSIINNTSTILTCNEQDFGIGGNVDVPVGSEVTVTSWMVDGKEVAPVTFVADTPKSITSSEDADGNIRLQVA